MERARGCGRASLHNSYASLTDNLRDTLDRCGTLLADCSSNLLYDDPALGIDEHVIAVAVFAGRRVVAIGIAPGVDDLVARHALQGNRGAKVLAHGIVRGKRESDMTCDGHGGESENNFATDHDFSLRL